VRKNESRLSSRVGGRRALAALGTHPALRRGVPIAVVGLVLLFFVLALARQWPDIVAYHWQVDPGYLLLAAGLLLSRAPLQVYSWKRLLARLGHTISWRVAFRLYFQSALAKYLPGSIWFAVGRVVLAEGVGLPRRATSVSVVLEQVLNTVAALLVSGLALTALPSGPIWPYVAVFLALGLFVVWPRPVFSALDWGLRRLGRAPLGLTLHGGDLLLALVPFVANWLWYGVASYCWTATVYPTLPAAELPAIIGLYTASWAIGFLTLLVPNGWAVREGLLVAGLTGVLGIPLPVAGAAALLSRLGSILVEAFWALFVTRFK
jgi:uncharacterized membrane protein YbhN (UPF0104 family)